MTTPYEQIERLQSAFEDYEKTWSELPAEERERQPPPQIEPPLTQLCGYYRSTRAAIDEWEHINRTLPQDIWGPLMESHRRLAAEIDEMVRLTCP